MRSRLEAACAEAGAEIDRIVYALYGPTGEGIAVVGGRVDASSGTRPPETNRWVLRPPRAYDSCMMRG